MFLPALLCLCVISILSGGVTSYSGFSYNKFNRYGEIVRQLNRLTRVHRTIAKVEHIGHSYEGRQIPCIRISSNPRQRTRPMIMVDAGIHAREWIAPAVALRLISELLENFKNRRMIDNVDWLIIPVVNPDGYEYTHTKDRMWRKNRSRGQYCRGVDLNRNFGFHWMEKDSSDNECTEIYAGSRAFSEPESNAVKYILTKFKSQIKLYVTLHSYGPLILYPWSFTKSAKPENAAEHAYLAKTVTDAIRKNNGTIYKYGSSTEIFDTISGVSDDWAKGVLGIPIIFTIELPSGGKTGFDPPPSAIIPIGTETFEGFKEMHKYIDNKWGRPSGYSQTKRKMNYRKYGSNRKLKEE